MVFADRPNLLGESRGVAADPGRVPIACTARTSSARTRLRRNVGMNAGNRGNSTVNQALSTL